MKKSYNNCIEKIIAKIVLVFCENAAELGCPKEKEVDMWFRELEIKEQFKVSKKIYKLIKEYYTEKPK